MDRIDGGVSVLLRCPGFPVAQDFSVENVSVDAFITPHIVEVSGMQERLAYLIQSFGDHVAVPHLHRFTVRHAAAGKPSFFSYCVSFRIHPPMCLTIYFHCIATAAQLKIQGPTYLPQFETPGSGQLRVRCRPAHTLAQDISIMKTPLRLRTKSPSYSTPARSLSRSSSNSDIVHIKFEDPNELPDSPVPPPTPRGKSVGATSAISRSEGPMMYGTLSNKFRSGQFVYSKFPHLNRVQYIGITDGCYHQHRRTHQQRHGPLWTIRLDHSTSPPAGLL
jgi:hypothetical protein